MTDHTAGTAGTARPPAAPLRVTMFTPTREEAPEGRSTARLQRAHHDPRPKERPAAHDPDRDHRGRRTSLGLGAVGRLAMGPEPARRRPRDHHRAAPRTRGPGGRARWRGAHRVLSRHVGAASRGPCRSGCGSSAPSIGPISTIRWVRPTVGRSSSSTRPVDIAVRFRCRHRRDDGAGKPRVAASGRSRSRPWPGPGRTRSRCITKRVPMRPTRRNPRRFAATAVTSTMWISGIAYDARTPSNARCVAFEAIIATPAPALVSWSTVTERIAATRAKSPSPRRRTTSPPSTLSMIRRGQVPAGPRSRHVSMNRR